jgi:hypothetical protein
MGIICKEKSCRNMTYRFVVRVFRRRRSNREVFSYHLLH